MDIFSSNLYLAFVAISFVLIVTPGPSVLLIVSQSLFGGTRRGLLTVLGTNLGMLIPLGVAIAGANAVAAHVTNGLTWIRWAGVAWLLFQGVAEIRNAGRRPAPAGGDEGRYAWQAIRRGFVVSLLNPTTTPFFFAFLPQFVDTSQPALPQLMTLGATFLIMAAILDCIWALLAARLGDRLAGPRLARWRGRIAGTLLIACAAGLAVARVG